MRIITKLTLCTLLMALNTHYSTGSEAPHIKISRLVPKDNSSNQNYINLADLLAIYEKEKEEKKEEKKEKLDIIEQILQQKNPKSERLKQLKEIIHNNKKLLKKQKKLKEQIKDLPENLNTELRQALLERIQEHRKELIKITQLYKKLQIDLLEQNRRQQAKRQQAKRQQQMLTIEDFFNN